jgi:ribosomal protein S6--L-glutamate ligase
MLLSFHPCYVGDENRLCAGRDPDDDDRARMRAAEAVILPQGCRKTLFDAAVSSCPRVFPDYTARFAWPEKTGQSRMFAHYNTPRPVTAAFDSLAEFNRQYNIDPAEAGFVFPFVFKYNGSGEGANVWLADTPNTLARLLRRSADWEKTGQFGFLLQQYIETRGRSLRVVVVGNTLVSYWRIQPDNTGFQASAARGGRIDHTADPGRRTAAEEQVLHLFPQTGINLAGFDLIFSENPAPNEADTPLLLEINYFFGRTGLGGSEAFYRLLCAEINKWIEQA